MYRYEIKWTGETFTIGHTISFRDMLFVPARKKYVHKGIIYSFSWMGLAGQSYNCFRMSFAEKGHFIMSLTQFPYFFHSAPHITPIRHIRFGRPHTLHFRFAGNIFSKPNISKLLLTRHQRYVDLPFTALLCPLLRHNEPKEICRPLRLNFCQIRTS